MKMTHRLGYKHTPLGWIPEDWHLEELSSLADVKTGPFGAQLHQSDYVEVGTPIITVEHLSEQGIVHKNLPRVSDYDKSRLAQYILNENDIVFSRVGSVDRNTLVTANENGWLFSGRLLRVRIRNGSIHPCYLSYYLNTERFKQLIKRVAVGQTMPSLNTEILSAVNIVIPALLEQQCIAEILSNWDGAITKTQQLITQLKERNKGLIHQLLLGKKRLKGFEGEWKRLHIFDIANEVSLKNHDDKQLTVLSCTKYDGLVPSLEYFGRRVFGDDTSAYKIVPLRHFAYATNHIEEGSIGYQNIFDEALISPMYTVFKTNGQVHDDYLFKLFKSHHYIHEYCKRMEGSIDRRGGLRWDEFSKIVIHLPGIDEQIAIATLINKAVEEAKINKEKLATLHQQKKGLMQKLLTGEVRVKIK